MEEKMFCGLCIISMIHSGFNVSCKPCLDSCSLKWPKPSLGIVITQIPPGLCQLQTEFGDGRMNLWILLLKTKKLSDFLRWGSKLFNSVMVAGKKVFRRMLCIFRVEWNERLVGIKLKIYLGFSFSKTLQKRQSFPHQRRSLRDSSPNSC